MNASVSVSPHRFVSQDEWLAAGVIGFGSSGRTRSVPSPGSRPLADAAFGRHRRSDHSCANWWIR